MIKIIPFILALFLATPVLAGSPFGDVMKSCPKVNGVCVEGSFLKKLSTESNIPIAKAGPHAGRGWGHRPGWGWGNRPRYNSGDAIIGGVIGGVIGNWLFRPEPEVVVVPAPPPPVPELQPWSSAWYEYCTQKYQTFDAKTGYYVGMDGERHFCQ